MKKIKRYRIFAILAALLICVSTGCSHIQTSLPDTDSRKTDLSEKPAASSEEIKTDDKDSEKMDLPLSDGITIPEITKMKLNAPSNEGIEFVKGLKIGWNLGNTFDAYNDGNFDDEMTIEEYWQHTYTTREMIKDIHDMGFETIRIPVSWHNHVSSDITISEKWLARVNEVVDWALDEGMYVIIDIHHDNHPEAGGFYPDRAHLESSKKYIGRIWEQLAERFKDYDEHLIFEGMNEPRLVGHANEWWIETGNADCIESIECINELNQLFVDTVRASGANNSTRYLMVPGYDASVDGAMDVHFKFPEDPAGDQNRLILSVHAYIPYNFTQEYPGIKNFNAKDTESTREIESALGRVYDKYLLKGIPVLIGEFGARDKGGNLQDRVDFAAYFIATARAKSMTAIWWDNNSFSGSGENYGIYNRKDPDSSTFDIIAALMRY